MPFYRPPTPEELAEAINRRYSVPRILLLRRKLLTAQAPFLTKPLATAGFQAWVQALTKALPREMPALTIRESLEPSAGRVLTPALQQAVAWRLAGNQQLLIRGDRVYPWVRQPYSEWVPAQVLRVRRSRSNNGRVGQDVYLRLMAGLAAGWIVNRFWTDAVCRLVACKIGFSRWPPSPKSSKPHRRAYNHPSELVSTRLEVLLEPRYCAPRLPGFWEWREASALVSWNRSQLEFRDRLDDAHACPYDQPATLPCYRCPIGSGNCRAACRPLDLTFGPCPRCKKPEVPFDPAVPSLVCMICRESDDLKKKD